MRVLPGKNTGVGCHAPLQGIFLTQGSNPGLLHCRQILHHLSHQGSLIICSTLLCLQSFPASESFPMSQLYTSGGKSGASVSASVFPMNIQGWFPLELTGLISCQSKGLSRLHLHAFHQRFLTAIQGQKRSGLKFNEKNKGLLCLKFFLRSIYLFMDEMTTPVSTFMGMWSLQWHRLPH